MIIPCFIFLTLTTGETLSVNGKAVNSIHIDKFSYSKPTVIQIANRDYYIKQKPEDVRKLIKKECDI